MLRLGSTLLAAALICTATLRVHAQGEDASWTFDTYTPGVCSPNGGAHGGCPAGELVRIRVVTVAHGLVRPWHLTFLPDSADFLVTELPGRDTLPATAHSPRSIVTTSRRTTLPMGLVGSSSTATMRRGTL